MTSEDLRQIIKRGETSLVQFKEMFSASAKIADEMIAFANSRGGVIVFGIKDKTGEIVGLSFEQVQELSREVGNIANDQVRIEGSFLCGALLIQFLILKGFSPVVHGLQERRQLFLLFFVTHVLEFFICP